MHVRKQLLAAGSTATLVAGGLFFSAAPASAVHDSPECISAQNQFTAALHNAELNAELCARIRAGELTVETPGLLLALQVMAKDQIAIDQPSYKPEGTPPPA